MIEIARILCPVDYSEFARHAFDHAVAIGRWYGGRVVALHVVPPVTTVGPGVGAPLYPPLVYTADDFEQFRAVLDDFIRAEGGGAGVPLEAEVVEGSAARAIVERAATLGADLIVTATHGRSGFERLMLGSVTERVIHHAPCPVLTVPPRAPDAVPAGPLLYRRILCAVDFSASSDVALTYAASLAMGGDARLSVLHVVEVAVPAMEPVPMGGVDLLPADRAVREAARSQLRQAISDEVRNVSHVDEVVAKGKPYREILRVAEEERSDLIVMGVHGGLAGALGFGSTTNHVVRSATCPVLTVRA